MASSSVRLQPSELFNDKSLDEWPCWMRRFLQFCDDPGLGEESDQKQVMIIFYCMGKLPEDILTSANISTEDRNTFQSVIAKFDRFFRVRKNVIFKCARCNCRSQEEGELVEKFITSLSHVGYVQCKQYGFSTGKISLLYFLSFPFEIVCR